MFKIYDGRNHFYQWDLDRKLIVYDDSITEVHFCNKTDECSLVCEVYTEGALRLVNVPNILLQDNWRLNVYAYDGTYTKQSKQFDVKSRSKPADYVYTETEVKEWETLEERITSLENGGIPDIPLEGLATVEYVDTQVAKVSDNTMIVNITPISETEGISDKSFMEVQEAYQSGKEVRCKFINFDLPLCFLHEYNSLIFGGATGNNSVFVSITNGNEANKAEYMLMELATKKQLDVVANMIADLPTGGGNIASYETNFVLEEDVNNITFTLPVDAAKFYMWKLSYRTPNTGVTDKRTVYLWFGGGFKNLGALTNFGCVGLAGVRHIPKHFAVTAFGRDDEHIEHCSAGFTSGSGNVDAEDGRNDVSLETPNNIPFPIGTEVWFWGVYSQ